MAIVAASILGGAALGGSVFSAIKGADAQKKMAKALEMQAYAAMQQLKFNQQRYNDFQGQYGDLIDMNIADAKAGVHGDYQGVTNRAATDVATQFDQQQDAQRRQMMAYGLDPSSGRFQSADRQAGLQEATASALAQNQARNQERQYAQNATRQLRLGVGEQGLSQMNMAASGVNSAMQGLQQSYGNQANTYGSMANNLFAQAGQMAGIGIGTIAGGFSDAAKTKATVDPSLRAPSVTYNFGSSMPSGYGSYQSQGLSIPNYGNIPYAGNMPSTTYNFGGLGTSYDADR